MGLGSTDGEGEGRGGVGVGVGVFGGDGVEETGDEAEVEEDIGVTYAMYVTVRAPAASTVLPLPFPLSDLLF